MEELKPIRSALISVYHKDRIDLIVRQLQNLGIEIYSTGGTYTYISSLGIPAKTVESLTDYPSILGGRVKTLHPKVFGGILYRRNHEADLAQVAEYEIPPIDLVIVDLYPFELTVSSGATHEEIIEKIDIGGISLIRAAAKNYQDVLIVASSTEYDDLIQLLEDKKGFSTLVDRHYFAAHAFNISSHYDTAIFNYLNRDTGIKAFKQSVLESETMRYGENPHQEGIFYGNLSQMFEQLNGKAISFNNVVDLDSAIALIAEFKDPF
ncbi:MAG: bifunctional phosphoribosylaminoimidazolecarboxamide formyltransferase/IMP cyclohydrolase PurH, partial [Bacteroidetes bacterium]|nr:bifunctional phosphoribosylaminoimidazolecarboxamide formyltransferase/IMP cyclohydrolase PurH [Bacteroidota bacterium]